MKRQSGSGGFPAILLTFSLLLLVLAVGFVVGRVVVARAYLDKAPKFDVQAASAPEMPSELGGGGAGPRAGGEARERGPAAQPRETAPEQDVAEARTYSIQVGVFTSRPGGRE